MGRPCLCVQRASGQVNGALVLSWEHSVSLFLLDHSSWTVNLSQLLFSSPLKLFPAVSIWFPLISSCLLLPFLPFIQRVLVPVLFSSSSALLSFSASVFPSFLSVCSFFYLFSVALQHNAGEERTELFKISKDRSGGLTGSPSFYKLSLPFSDR